LPRRDGGRGAGRARGPQPPASTAHGWRFDYAWPPRRQALEIEGGTWTGGRHVRGRGYEGDCEKYNAAALAGWTVLRETTAMIRDGRALDWLRRALTAPDCHA
jgi:hypothetical protein